MKKYNKLAIIAGLFLVFTFGCGLTNEKNKSKGVPISPSPAPQGFRYLALGDSYTIGQGVKITDRFPNQLRDSLVRHNFPINSFQIIARTGWSTAQLLEAIQAQQPDTVAWDIVTLLIGVNNQYRKLGLEPYKAEFTDLLQRAIRLAGGKKSKVFVLSIPDYSVTPYAQRLTPAKIYRELEAYNAANRAITLAEGVAYINITPASQEATDNRKLLAPNGLHPAGLMYRSWVRLLLPRVLESLR